jgi:hypothetical protein
MNNKGNIMKSFSEETKSKLEYYVYRLVDPRSGLTFYVGKGKGDRVFDHVYSKNTKAMIEMLSEYEEIDNLKIEVINEIQSEGLEVIHLIHRHGMDSKTAYEVEGALIDAYGGLANKVNGHNNDYGITNAIEINNRYTLREFTDLDVAKSGINKFIIFKVRKSTIESLEGDYENRLYEATRGEWTASYSKVKNYKYALSVVEGIVKQIYEINEWRQIPNKNRVQFIGQISTNERLKAILNTRIPQQYRKKGAQSPFLYSK